MRPFLPLAIASAPYPAWLPLRGKQQSRALQSVKRSAPREWSVMPVPVGSIYSFSALTWSFTGRQCVGYDHRYGGRTVASSRRPPVVPPHRLLPEKPQVNRLTEYLDPTGFPFAPSVILEPRNFRSPRPRIAACSAA